jgi:hypothetical protein
MPLSLCLVNIGVCTGKYFSSTWSVKNPIQSPQGCCLVANKRVVKAFVLLSRSRVQTSSYLEARLAGGVVLPRGYKEADGI